jgi:hypothetical protein
MEKAHATQRARGGAGRHGIRWFISVPLTIILLAAIGTGVWFYFSNTGNGVAGGNSPTPPTVVHSVLANPTTEPPTAQPTEPTATATAQPTESPALTDNSHLSLESMRELSKRDPRLVWQIADYGGYTYVNTHGVVKEIAGRVLTIGVDQELSVYIDESVPIITDLPGRSWEQALKEAIKIEEMKIGDIVQIQFIMPIGQSRLQVYFVKYILYIK